MPTVFGPRPTGRRLVLAFLALAAAFLPASADVVDDHPVPAHRRAEAERKAEQLARWTLSKAIAPTAEQEQVDTGYVELEIDFDTGARSLAGTVRYSAQVLSGPVAVAVLDLDQALTVTATRSGGASTIFTHATDRVTVDLDRSYATGETFTVEVDYQGQPDESHGAFGFTTAESQDLIWSLSEPFGARTWWPIKDTPSDKADSMSIAFTVDSSLFAVSNGRLQSTTSADGRTRYEWKERHPIAPYLVSIAAHPYVEQSATWHSTLTGPLPVQIWSYASQTGPAASALAQTLAMLDAYEGLFGPWPFPGEKYGQAQFNWGGGMEHQTASSMCCWNYPGLIAHELTHQWFGDLITCENFTEIWTNEGFATYGEALWREVAEGPSGYFAEMQTAKYLGGGTIRVPEEDLDDFSRIFNGGLSYNKASWVLHMLRGVMGDATFFQFLTDYTADPQVAHGTTTTADVQRVAETTSGLDLGTFFHQWIDQSYYPTYALDWSAEEDAGNWTASVTLEQLQSHHVFEMPITLRVNTAAGTVDHVVISDESLATYALSAPAEPTSVELDPDGWVLHTVETAIADPTFHRGVLLVNGVSWDTYGSEIRNAHADSVFTGQHPFELWDLFPEPSSGYPAELPPPLGQGPIPPDILGQFSTVVWVGNNYQGDLDGWTEAAILSYLNQGGNVLLLGRMGQDFLTPARAGYFGVRFAEGITNSIQTATAAHPDLVSMSPTATQSFNAVFETAFDQPNAVLLFRETESFAQDRGLGVWRKPEGGGSLRPSGGNFAFVSGRPYRWDPIDLRQNTEVILGSLFQESLTPTAVEMPQPTVTALRHAVPNPFNPRTTVNYTMAERERVRLDVYDLRGRRVRSLLDGIRPRGEGAAVWDGTDDRGRAVASGVYSVRLVAGDVTDLMKITLVR